MKKLGLEQEEVEADVVVIKKPDGTRLFFSSPSVTKMNMGGQATFQIAGKYEEIAPEPQDVRPEINEDDVKTVVAQTGATEADARKAIEECNGDLAEAIMKLKSE